MSWCFDDFVELDDGGVSNEFEDMDLARDPFYIGDIDDFFLDKNFDGNFFSGEGMGGHFDFSESSFADGFAEQVIANFFMLVSCLLIHKKQIINLYNEGDHTKWMVICIICCCSL